MENQKKNKKSGSGGILGAVAAVFLFNLVGTDAGGALISIILVIGIMVLIIYFISRFAKKSGNINSRDFKDTVSGITSQVTGSSYRKKEAASVSDKEYIPRREEPKRQYYDASDAFDNYQRDKERRIEQLKVFLENGIIDKNEYQVLLRKYQEDTINYR